MLLSPNIDPQFISAFLSFLVILFFLFFRKKTLKTAQNLPPGPRKLPIIGNIHELGGYSQHVVLSNMSKKYGPLMHLQLAEISAIVVSSSSMAKHVYKTHDLAFSDRDQVQLRKIILGGCKDVVFNRYDDYWRQMRKICTVDLFTANKVKAFRSIREDEAWSLVESIRNSLDSPVNLTQKFCSLANSITCRAAIGEKSKYQDELVHAIEAMAFLGGGFDIVDLFPSYGFLHVFSGVKSQLKRIKSRLDDIFFNIIKEHEEKRATTKDSDGCVAGEEDLVDVLLRVQEKNDLNFPITSKNIQGVICCVLLPKECREQCEIEGYTIPVGTKLIVNTWAINRDPKYWPNGESFEPELFENSSIDYNGTNLNYLPFGAGRRSCPGISFGIATIELPLASLLYHFDWQVPHGKPEDLDMSDILGLTLKRKSSLMLKAILE